MYQWYDRAITTVQAQFINAREVIKTGIEFDNFSSDGYTLRDLEIEIAGLRADKAAQMIVSNESAYALLKAYARSNRIWMPFPDA